MYKVYILQSVKDCRTYIGYSSDVLKRLIEHNSGRVDATKKRRPLRIIYTENVENLELAKKREKYWKNGSGRRKLRGYFKNGFPSINCN